MVLKLILFYFLQCAVMIGDLFFYFSVCLHLSAPSSLHRLGFAASDTSLPNVSLSSP